jgi:tetratricopeptide (TPR) repeat protein
MNTLAPAVHRTIVGVDVERFGDRRRTHPDQIAVRDGLYQALERAFTRAGIDWERCYCEDRGDGALILVPSEVPKALLAQGVPVELAAAAADHNLARDQRARIRLRLAMHAGEIHHDRHGVTGTAINTAFRLLEAEPLKQALAGSPGTLAVIASRWFYEEVIRHAPACTPGSWRRVRVSVKETREDAWVCLPDAPYLPEPDADLPPSPEVAVPRQLPAAVAGFAGRAAELEALTGLLEEAAPPGGTVVISAVAGMAGVGKTALAVHWAWQVAGRFPDGQLYVNLRGYDPGAPVTPEEAVGWFLVALGAPAAQIPADAQARYGLYRSVLAGRRVLIVLDNARDAAQVRPLLPGSPGCLVVVTSRSALAGLAAAEGAHPLRLGPLAGQEGAQLLAARLGPERLAAEPEAAAGLTAWCGGLPLALAVMAAQAAADPGLPLGALAALLAGAAGAEAAAAGQDVAGAAPGRLEVLETGDPATSLRQLLSWSYRQLSPSAAQMFTLLGVHRGPDITVPAAASLAGVSRAEAGRALAELAQASLAAEHRPGRYVMHDLVRGYAAEQARQTIGEAGIRAATGRSLDHYLHTMILASDIALAFTVTPLAPGVVPEMVADEAGLLGWVQAEHQVLLQATAQAAAAGFITHAWQLFARQSWFLGDQGYWADFRTAGQAVLAAARAVGDNVALGWTHAIIGRYGSFSGAADDGRVHQQLALDHFRRAGDLAGQGWAHMFTGLACTWKGGWAEAATQCGQALALFRQAGDQYGEGWALAGLGECHARLGNYDLARSYASQALEADPATGDPTTLAFAWHALGFVHARLGGPGQAISCYQQALALVRERKHALARMLLVRLLAESGDASRAAGDLPAAAEAWEHSLQLLDDLGWPDLLGVRARLEAANPHG